MNMPRLVLNSRPPVLVERLDYYTIEAGGEGRVIFYHPKIV
jgi:hypothetical protein